MFPGRYRVVVTPPAGYSAPSVATQAQIAALPGAPFAISAASYLQAFDLTGTGMLNLTCRSIRVRMSR